MSIQILFWPLVILSILLSAFGIYKKNPTFLYISASLILPLSLYLAMTPLFRYWGVIFPLLYVVSGILIRHQKNKAAIIVATPVYLLIGWTGFTVLSQ